MLIFPGIIFFAQNSFSQCTGISYPSQGNCTCSTTGCTSLTGSGTTTYNTNNSSVCYTLTGNYSTVTVTSVNSTISINGGSQTLTTLNINLNNGTSGTNGYSNKIYLCGNITIGTLNSYGNNDTVYVCGNVTINNWGYTGGISNIVSVINQGASLTLTNAPAILNTGSPYSFKVVNYGTLNSGANWTMGGETTLVNASSISAINFGSHSLTVNGGILYMNGGNLTTTGALTIYSTNSICMGNFSSINVGNISNSASNGITMLYGYTGCVSYTGSATVYNYLSSSSSFYVCAASSATGTAYNSASWPKVTVLRNCSVTCTQVLPLTLTDFSVNSSFSNVILKWRVSSEQNKGQFEVQRSDDGIEFSDIGTVAASENYTSQTEYNFIDHSPVIGNNFYRLKLLTDNGNPSYSEVKKIEIIPPTEMKTITSASQNYIQIIMPQNSSNSTLRLLDMQGRVLKTVLVTGQQESINIQTSNIASGIYVVELISLQTHQAKQVYLSSAK